MWEKTYFFMNIQILYEKRRFGFVFFLKKNMLDFYFEECKADFTKKNIDNIL